MSRTVYSCRERVNIEYRIVQNMFQERAVQGLQPTGYSFV